MADLNAIPSDEETSYNKGAAALYNLIKEVLPNHKLIASDVDLPKETTPYITLNPSELEGFQDNGIGNKPIYTKVDSQGITTKVYQEKCQWRIRSYKGKAFSDLKKVKSAVENDEAHYRHFGKDGVIGLTSIGSVRRTPTVIDFQKMENSATMLITLTYLHKYVDDTGQPIDKLDLKLKSKSTTSTEGGITRETDTVIDPSKE